MAFDLRNQVAGLHSGFVPLVDELTSLMLYVCILSKMMLKLKEKAACKAQG